jgi:hypothetical protein
MIVDAARWRATLESVRHNAVRALRRFDRLDRVSGGPRNIREEAVLQRLDAMAGEMVEFLRALIAIPTVNPPGENYAACADWLGRRLA